MSETKNIESAPTPVGLDNRRLNAIRAAVLGANDGIVSISSIAMGVIGATSDIKAISIASLAALTAGALSMAVGEYVSVSSQSDSEKAYIASEEQDLRANPDQELEQLTRGYQARGVSRATAEQVARELTDKDALGAHLQLHFNLDPSDINSPWQAAIASLLAFTAGGLVPFLAVILSPSSLRIPIIALSVVCALVAVGFLSARAGNAPKLRAIVRVVIGGLIAMAVTYGIGTIFGMTM